VIKRAREAGFSLIELMVVVVIILVLAAVAIPSFMKYLTNAKTAEARIQIEKITMGARAYYLDSFASKSGGSIIERQFPATVGMTPAVTCCAEKGRKCLPNAAIWDNPSWVALSYSMDDAHNYRYEFISSGTSTASAFTARAKGDLDCDGLESTFEMYGTIGAGGEPESSAGLVRIKQLE
jgi:prepilin-type N-terminal cleavage/methylation domain-containing protein